MTTLDDAYNARVNVAEKECRRFLDRIKSYNRNGTSCGKEHAAMLRASMDLSRALSDVRRGRYR